MALVISVQADSREKAVAWLDRVCRDYGMTPVMRPMRSTGTDRWLARATPTAPAEDEGREG